MTDSYGGVLEPISGLGILNGSHCPHYDGEVSRKPAYRKLIQAGTIQSGIALDNGVAANYIAEELHQIVSSRPGAHAYYVSKKEEALQQPVLL